MSFALVAAGCGGTSSSDDPTGAAAHTAGTGSPQSSAAPPGPASSAPAEPPASPGTTKTTAAGATAGSGSGSGSGSARCTAEGLTMSVRRADAGAGHLYYRLTFVNKSARSCTLNGFPGVSLIKRDGSVIGVPAKRDGASHGRTVIAPGKAANATLQTLNQHINGSGCWDRADYLRVYPPGSKEALTLRDPQLRICGDRFTTTSVGD
ncbi:DUF4232 domain-containing protein [Streptomyces sp. A1277]|uniref:DUF4232 domain-containing protein n=1 Tax=Streptomyces sp. A1277 TaxID=2563103 RepID=UPI0019D1E80F|nr:DUF4232 domain-containing protein [Streptomyces sp. A1277]